jgi:hypothetical protein
MELGHTSAQLALLVDCVLKATSYGGISILPAVQTIRFGKQAHAHNRLGR